MNNAWIERQRHLFDYALRSLSRRLGKNLSLLILYSLIVFLLASVMFFTSAIKKEATVLLRESPDIVVQRMAAGRHDLIPAAYANKIAAMRGVIEIHPRLWGYYFDPATGANFTLMVPRDNAVDPNSVVIGAGLARNRGIEAGDLLSFRAYTGNVLLFLVEDLLPMESELLTTDLVLMSEESFRKVFNQPQGLFTDLAVSIGNPREIVTIAEKIVEAFPDSRPILKSEILRTYEAVFDWRGGMMVVLLLAAVFSFLVFAWDKAAGLSAEERREIGILKSIGWETGDVLLLKFWEGAAVSLTAFFLGVLSAYAHVFFFSAGFFEQALKGWAVLYPDFRLTPDLNPLQLSVLFFLTVLPYTVATILPSWRAATIDPDAAMRQ